MSVPMKRSAIAAAQEGSVLARCRALDLSSSSYYYQPKGESALNLKLPQGLRTILCVQEDRDPADSELTRVSHGSA